MKPALIKEDTMTTLSLCKYQELIQDANVLAEDNFGEKVLQLRDGTILKLFRVKRWWSSALFYNYAKRFFDNSKKLQKQKIITVNAVRYINIPEIKRTGVIYHPLSGVNIRDWATRHGNILSKELIERLAQFIAQLHNQGIYFRSLHLGNIILTTDDKLGIIDIADLKIKKQRLSDAWRLRNIQHMKRYDDDIALLQCGQNDLFIEAYLENAKPSLASFKEGQLRNLLVKK